MGTAILLFHGQLSDFLPDSKIGRPYEYVFNGNPSVKDVIEANGVPHCEVGAIRVNGGWCGFGYRLQDGDNVKVYHDSGRWRKVSSVRLRLPYEGPARFVLDVHLGKLARNLRMLGFDTLYRNDYDDPEIADISANEGRIALTSTP